MFYSNIWDPYLILSQILLLQSLFYLLVGCWLLLFSLAFGTPLSLALILNPSLMHMFRGGGWPPIGAFLLVAPMLGYMLLLVVGRAKQCLDFTLTLYFLHFLLSLFYSGGLHAGFPSNWEWWGVNGLACVLSVVMGEYLCLQKELEAIPMTAEEQEMRQRRSQNQQALNSAAASSSSSSSSSVANGDGHERASLINQQDLESRGERGVVTTTIRLAPSNSFNV